MITLYKKTKKGVEKTTTDPAGLKSLLAQGWVTSPCGTKKGMEMARLQAEIMRAKHDKDEEALKKLEAKLAKALK